MLVRDRQRDRTRARADVEHARLLLPGEQGEAALDHDLRFGTGHERALVGLEHDPAEAPLPQHVGEGLATSSPPHELARSVALRLRQWPVVVRVELDAREAE